MANQALEHKAYDLISVVYHAAQGDDNCRRYMEDAQKEGDDEAVQFFKEAQEQNQQIVQKGKDLLKQRL